VTRILVVGTPAGAASMRRVLDVIKTLKLVWITDVEAVVTAAGEKL
jgi:allantoinase